MRSTTSVLEWPKAQVTRSAALYHSFVAAIGHLQVAAPGQAHAADQFRFDLPATLLTSETESEVSLVVIANAVFSTGEASFTQLVHITVHKIGSKLVDNWVADLALGQLHSS